MPSVEDLDIETPAPHKVLVIGASYAGLAAGLNLLDLCVGKPSRFSPKDASSEVKAHQIPVEIKFVDERDGFCKNSVRYCWGLNLILIARYADHLIGSPLALASKEYASKAWTKFEDIPALHAPGLNLVRGTVLRVDCERKVALISDPGAGKEFEESYDYLVASSGLRRAWPAVPQSLRREKYLAEVNDHIEKVKNAPKGVVVIGGGESPLLFLFPISEVDRCCWD